MNDEKRSSKEYNYKVIARGLTQSSAGNDLQGLWEMIWEISYHKSWRNRPRRGTDGRIRILIMWWRLRFKTFSSVWTWITVKFLQTQLDIRMPQQHPRNILSAKARWIKWERWLPSTGQEKPERHAIPPFSRDERNSTQQGTKNKQINGDTAERLHYLRSMTNARSYLHCTVIIVTWWWGGL